MTRRDAASPIMSEPARCPAIARRFDRLHDQLVATQTPEQILQVARNTLEPIRIAFREYNEIYTEQLRRVHRPT